MPRHNPAIVHILFPIKLAANPDHATITRARAAPAAFRINTLELEFLIEVALIPSHKFRGSPLTRQRGARLIQFLFTRGIRWGFW